MTSPNDKPWYQSGLRFQCTGCGCCCTGEPGYVWVNAEEIAVLAAALEMDVKAFEAKYVRREGSRRSLIELADGDCVFFDNRRRCCTVYQARPRQCRTWPFWASNLRSPGAWKQMADRCPGANLGPLVGIEHIRACLGKVHVSIRPILTSGWSFPVARPIQALSVVPDIPAAPPGGLDADHSSSS